MNTAKRILILTLLITTMCGTTVYGAVAASYTANCTGLTAGEKYRVHVELVDTATGELARNGGNALVCDKEFTATGETATVKANLKVDESSNAGKTLAIKAKLYKGSKRIDILSDGSGNTIVVPKASPPEKESKPAKKPGKSKNKKEKKAKKPSNKKGNNENVQQGSPEAEAPAALGAKSIRAKSKVSDGATGSAECKARTNTVIVDELELSGLEVGRRYEVRTELHDKKGKLLVKGAKKRSAFLAKGERGKVTVKLAIDASNLEGKSGTVLSEIYLDGALAGSTKGVSPGKRTVSFVPDVYEVDISPVRYSFTRSMLIVADSIVDMFDSKGNS